MRQPPVMIQPAEGPGIEAAAAVELEPAVVLRLGPRPRGRAPAGLGVAGGRLGVAAVLQDEVLRDREPGPGVIRPDEELGVEAALVSLDVVVVAEAAEGLEQADAHHGGRVLEEVPALARPGDADVAEVLARVAAPTLAGQ